MRLVDGMSYIDIECYIISKNKFLIFLYLISNRKVYNDGDIVFFLIDK